MMNTRYLAIPLALLLACSSERPVTSASRAFEASLASPLPKAAAPRLANYAMVVSAHPEASKIGTLVLQRGGNAYDAGCALARCVPIVEKDDKVTKEQRENQVQFYGNQAMAMLRAAVAKGYKDVEHMKKEKDLDALREREDFKKLLGELEAKQEE